MFDNGRYRKWSRLLEINPITKEIVWQQKADYTLSQGFVQRLEDGSHLVTISEDKKAYIVDKNGNKLWEFNSTDKDWIYRMVEYDIQTQKNLLTAQTYQVIYYSSPDDKCITSGHVSVVF